MKRAIINSRMIDVETGAVHGNTTIVWADGVIEEISNKIDLPSDVDIIDGTGCFVTPGLINGFTHLGLKEYGVRWEGDDAYEASGTNQLNLSVVDGIYPFDHAFAVARASGITTAHVSPGPENVISGITAIIKTSGTVVDEMIVQARHGLSVSLGEVPKKAYLQKFKQPLTRMGIASLIREQLRKASFTDQPDGPGDEILSKILDKTAPMYVRAYRADDIGTAIRLKEEFNIDVILVHATEADQVVNTLSEADIPVLAGPFFSSKVRYETRNLHPSTTVALHNAGIPTALVTPTVRNLPLEGALAIREGLSETEALYALTLGAARIMGLSEQLGSIKPGKQADLVLWSGEPLELKTTVLQTVVGGLTVYKKESTTP